MRRGLLILSIAMISALMLGAAGCGKKSLKGTPAGNKAPTIAFSNTPPENYVFTSNPHLTWSGTDEDGRVIGYYYLVVQDDSVGNPADYLDSLPPDSLWINVPQESTTVTVRFFASSNETDTVGQYVFVKCVDDDGQFSPTIYRRYSRVNRPPQTYIRIFPGKTDPSDSLPPDQMVGEYLWVLPDTTRVWSGLKITWEGKDTLDFPDGEPDFDYEWNLYGPYDTSTAAALTIADTSADLLVRWSYNDSTGSHWLFSKEVVLKDLRTGAYIFTVRVRDDAQVPDPTPAWNKFVLVEPVWISSPDAVLDILIIQATQYRTQSDTTTRGYPRLNNPASFPDSIRQFYRDMIDGTGVGYSYTIYGNHVTGTTLAPVPPISVFARHRMVIVDNADFNKGDLYSPDATTENPMAGAIRRYLQAGGKAWVIGRQVFQNNPGIVGKSDYSSQSLPFQYFDISYGTFSSNAAVSQTAEFMAANPTPTSPFERLVVDQTKCRYMYQFNLSKVDVMARYSSNSTTLLTYEAINPDTSYQDGWPIHAMPVAMVYEPSHGAFKTSVFTFPLYFMDNSGGEVQHVFNYMLAWFLDD